MTGTLGSVVMSAGTPIITGELYIEESVSGPSLFSLQLNSDPGASGVMGQINFNATDASASAVTYGYIQGIVASDTHSATTGEIRFNNNISGVATAEARLTNGLSLSLAQPRGANTALTKAYYLTEATAPASPAAGSFVLYMDISDHKLKAKAESGTVTILATQ
jgi:hypothetical protein